MKTKTVMTLLSIVLMVIGGYSLYESTLTTAYGNGLVLMQVSAFGVVAVGFAMFYFLVRRKTTVGE